jgi:uncharacterized membrane protein
MFFVLGAVLLVACYLLGRRWQLQIRELMDAPTEPFYSQLLLPIVAVLIFAGLVEIGRLLRKLYRWLARLLDRWMGQRAARAIGWVAVTGLTVLLITGVLFDGLMRFVDSSFSLLDKDTTPGIVQPTTTLRSGGPESLVAWNTLGTQGRDYIGSGPTQQQKAESWGAPATESVRA